VTGHPSQLQLDAVHLGVDDPAARAHLAGCARCRERVRVAEIDHRYFLASVMPRHTIGRARRAWWLGVSVFAMAAALVVMFVRTPTEEPVLGIKGAPDVQVYANQDGRVVALRDGMELRPGDRIRFVVLGAAHQPVVITSIDGADRSTVFFDGVPHAPRYEVPGSVILDDTLGPERLYLRVGVEPRRQILWFRKVGR
jgi:hypothetical protein